MLKHNGFVIVTRYHYPHMLTSLYSIGPGHHDSNKPLTYCTWPLSKYIVLYRLFAFPAWRASFALNIVTSQCPLWLTVTFKKIRNPRNADTTFVLRSAFNCRFIFFVESKIHVNVGLPNQQWHFSLRTEWLHPEYWFNVVRSQLKLLYPCTVHCL